LLDKHPTIDVAIVALVLNRTARGTVDNLIGQRLLWLSVRRFHVGTSATTLTQDAGYTTATDSRVELLNGVPLLALREGSIYEG
jgi:hypothetical protein